MDKLSFKVIEDCKGVNLFIKKVEDQTGVKLPLAYVTRGKIVGGFLNGRLAAGYLLVTRPDFRSLMFVPDSIRRSHPILGGDKYQLMEVNGLWVSPSVKHPRQQLQFWIHLVKDIFLCKKKYLLLMSSGANQTIHNIHELTEPTIVYEGKPKLLPNSATHKTVRIGFTTRWRLISNIPRYLAEFRGRQDRFSAAFKAKILART